MSSPTPSESDHAAVPAALSHELAVVEFRAENQPIDGASVYNAAIDQLADQLRQGLITLDEAKEQAEGALIASVWPQGV